MHIDPERASIELLQQQLGKALDAAIDKQGGKVAFAEHAGLNRATLYRLLRGENVGTEVLLRTLRALGRSDLLAELINPPRPSPLELRPPTKEKRQRGQRPASGAHDSLTSDAVSSIATDSNKAIAPPSAQRIHRSLVTHLALGRLPVRDTKDRDG